MTFMNDFIIPAGACSDEEISKFESAIGYSLPRDYRSFLLSTNGGDAVSNSIPIGGGDSTSIRAFYGLKSVGLKGNLISRIGVYDAEPDVPKNAIAIAFDDGGWSFMLYLSGARVGQVWLMDSERNLQFIGNDFSSFIDLIDITASEEEPLETFIEQPAPITVEEWHRRKAASRENNRGDAT
jgi:hypothetical protein